MAGSSLGIGQGPGGAYNAYDPTMALSGNPNYQSAVVGAQAGEQEARTAAQAQEAINAAQLALKGSEFNQAYGLLSNQISGQGSGNSGAGGPGGLGGYNTTAQPGVTTGPIWTPQQIAQQVNQSNAQGIQGAQTLQRQQANQFAGQGFGAGSPALQALQSNAMSQAIATNAANANNLQYNAAQGNAQQLLASQSQAQNAWNQAQNVDVSRRALNEQYAASLAGAIAGLV